MYIKTITLYDFWFFQTNTNTITVRYLNTVIHSEALIWNSNEQVTSYWDNCYWINK